MPFRWTFYAREQNYFREDPDGGGMGQRGINSSLKFDIRLFAFGGVFLVDFGGLSFESLRQN
jgi:hypothetical protein